MRLSSLFILRQIFATKEGGIWLLILLSLVVTTVHAVVYWSTLAQLLSLLLLALYLLVSLPIVASIFFTASMILSLILFMFPSAFSRR